MTNDRQTRKRSYQFSRSVFELILYSVATGKRHEAANNRILYAYGSDLYLCPISD